MKVNELRRLYKEKRKEIRKKLVEFRRNLEAPEKRIFYELIFCLLTPQSNAEVCDKVATVSYTHLTLPTTERV